MESGQDSFPSLKELMTIPALRNYLAKIKKSAYRSGTLKIIFLHYC